jgi:hypothetical protein
MYHLRRSGLHFDTACSKYFRAQRPTTFRRPTFRRRICNCEMRIDFGPGYRVYYARAGKMLYLLRCGGDKGRQDADIKNTHLKIQANPRRGPVLALACMALDTPVMDHPASREMGRRKTRELDGARCS